MRNFLDEDIKSSHSQINGGSRMDIKGNDTFQKWQLANILLVY